jgi:Nif-specific regulatory protein
MPSLKVRGPDGHERVFRWSEGSIGIGSDATNHLQLPGEGVSKWHAAVFHEAEVRYRLRDLGGGLKVAGRRVHAHPLSEGLMFIIGKCHLTFSHGLECQAEGSAGEPSLDPSESPAQQDAGLDVIQEYPSDFSWTCQEADARGYGSFPSPRKLFEALHAIAVRLDTDELLRALLHQIRQIAAPSVCLAALVSEEGTLDIRARHSSLAGGSMTGVPLYSKTLLEKVRENGKALFAREVRSVPDLAGAPSVRSLGIAAAICVPLKAGGKVQGIVYADWRRGRPEPSEPELDWIAALTLYAASAFENSLNHRDLQAGRDRLAQGKRATMQIIGISRAIRETIDVADRCASADVSVLLVGPSGSGKELVAFRIHDRSRRSGNPYVAINCAAVPKDLFESQLFGHAKGAFTGATHDLAGYFKEAHGGTLFLDEIGETPVELQAKLLRVLEDKEVRPIGGRPRKVDVRVIAGTNRDLKKAASEGILREDLLGRFHVRIPIASLRDRTEDIPILTHYLLDQVAAEMGKSVRGVSPKVMDSFMRYSWPLNVRELRRFLVCALLYCDDTVEMEHLRQTPEIAAEPGKLPSLDDIEKEHLVRVLKATRGNQAEAAKILGRTPNTIKDMIDRYSLDRKEFK